MELNPSFSLLKYFSSVIPKKNHPWNDIILTSRGRDAIELMISFLQLAEYDLVLLPALTCDTVTIPFKKTCKIVCYDLKNDYSIDVDSILYHIGNNKKIRLLYIINYFGFIQKELPRIHEICMQNNILVIEDHAHSALSHDQHQIADVKIFSFRKLFPTPDGGGIWFKDRSKFPLKFKYNLVDFLKSAFKGSAIGIKRKCSSFPWFRKKVERYLRNEKHNIYQRKEHIKILPISYFAKNTISSANIDAISDERRKQFFLWLSLFDETEFDPAFCYLNEETIPHCFPLKVGNPNEILEYFKKFNIYLKIHWPNLLAESQESCPVSHNLAKYSLSLPIFPGIKFSEMKFIRDEILKIGKVKKEA